jgi:hypothetical protein
MSLNTIKNKSRPIWRALTPLSIGPMVFLIIISCFLTNDLGSHECLMFVMHGHKGLNIHYKSSAVGGDSGHALYKIIQNYIYYIYLSI